MGRIPVSLPEMSIPVPILVRLPAIPPRTRQILGEVQLASETPIGLATTRPILWQTFLQKPKLLIKGTMLRRKVPPIPINTWPLVLHPIPLATLNINVLHLL